jgi:hypothetical protein
LTRSSGTRRLPGVTASLLGLALLAFSGCTGEPSIASSAADQPFNKEELAALRKSVKTQSEFRELLKIKAAERDGTAVVKLKASARKSKPN